MMKVIDRLNNIEHIKKNNTTYFQHFRRAITLGIKTGYATVALCIHSIFPNLFEKTGSSVIFSLHKQLVSETHND
jgi:hypothetical protein